MTKALRIAILDLYEGQANQGMRCIRELISQWSSANGRDVVADEFEVRIEHHVPDLSYDIYISSGGPGSPLESEGSDWEKVYFSWLESVEQFNNNLANEQKKYVFFICHSYQLAVRHYGLATVSKRNSTAFGVFPVHLSEEGKKDPVFAGLPDPLYAVDSRDYQVTQPREAKVAEMNARILAIEKARPHVPYERAVMAIRFNDYFLGTQFHPEADAIGMSMYLRRPDKKETVITNHGEEKWQSMITQLTDPDKILLTHDRVLPAFLDVATSRTLEPA